MTKEELINEIAVTKSKILNINLSKPERIELLNRLIALYERIKQVP